MTSHVPNTAAGPRIPAAAAPAPPVTDVDPRLQPADLSGRARRLRLRGGELDGHDWVGVIDVGRRVACATGRWSPQSVYVVTEETTRSLQGHIENVAVPALF